jgi:hypothetical protein
VTADVEFPLNGYTLYRDGTLAGDRILLVRSLDHPTEQYHSQVFMRVLTLDGVDDGPGRLIVADYLGTPGSGDVAFDVAALISWAGVRQESTAWMMWLGRFEHAGTGLSEPAPLELGPQTGFISSELRAAGDGSFLSVQTGGALVQFMPNGELCGIGETRAYPFDAHAASHHFAWTGRRAAVVWSRAREGPGQLPEHYDIFLRIIGADGTLISPEVQVSRPTADFTTTGRNVAWNGNEFAVVYVGPASYGAYAGAIYFSRFDKDGRRIGCDFILEDPPIDETYSYPQLIWDGTSWVLSFSTAFLGVGQPMHILHRFNITGAGLCRTRGPSP